MTSRGTGGKKAQRTPHVLSWREVDTSTEDVPEFTRRQPTGTLRELECSAGQRLSTVPRHLTPNVEALTHQLVGATERARDLTRPDVRVYEELTRTASIRAVRFEAMAIAAEEMNGPHLQAGLLRDAARAYRALGAALRALTTDAQAVTAAQAGAAAGDGASVVDEARAGETRTT